MLAYDAARSSMASSRDVLPKGVVEKLRRAKELKDAFEANTTAENQRAWVEAHNRATVAVLTAGGDVRVATSIYAGYTGRQYELR